MKSIPWVRCASGNVFKWKLVCLFHFLYYYAQIRLKVVLVQLCRYTERLGFVFLFPVRQFINRFPKVVVVAILCRNLHLYFAVQEEESPLNILCDSCLCCQRKLSSCICRTGNRIAAEEQLEFQFLAGIAAEQIVRQTNATNVTLHPLVQAPWGHI